MLRGRKFLSPDEERRKEKHRLELAHRVAYLETAGERTETKSRPICERIVKQNEEKLWLSVSERKRGKSREREVERYECVR